ncbi:MAG: SurA N-terminal domain-containing protein [Flavobacteriales bacterium]|jgi:peptidyl-prolyl cis-trans isomerase D|uniref:peptidylprolyl isomerase n=1 Tax=Candidatus Ulvibacter alkanivorans TaxID=2267620 RepID=UPI000DF1E4EE|nr:peptidylprolyl isomerase [Candidatus Ulvibacter alkanivorans]MCH2489297.1 SurA N-terminal domain-containing protein [Flavobacteriales bacterium]
MAVLSKIRQRSVFLIIIIALALFSFVLADVIRNGGFSSDKSQTTIATVNGTEISRQEFAEKVDAYEKQVGPNITSTQAVNTIWEREIRSTLLKEQYNELGLRVGADQLNAAYAQYLGANQNFTDANGQFSRAKLNEYMASIKQNEQLYSFWQNNLRSIEQTVLEQTYLNMVKGGLVSTLAEGERQYRFENDKINIEYVQIPYTSIADTDVPVSDAEIKEYVEAHPNEFQVDAQVDIQYVLFSEEPSESDIQEARASITALLDDRVERGDSLVGFRNTTDNEEFVNEYSDGTYVGRWQYKRELPPAISDTIFTMNEGEIYGPYQTDNRFNLTKLIERRQLPDSVEARHILIPIGLNPTDSITRNDAQAKAAADSILRVVRGDRSKFPEIVTAMSSDQGSVERGGHYDWFTYNMMVPAFRDFTFEGETGDIGVVKSNFGYHVIEIEGQKNMQPVAKIATVSKDIEASENTLNDTFSKAARFEEAAREGDFSEVAKEQNLQAKPVNKIGELDANIPGIGTNRGIVTWAFNEDTKVGDITKENTANGYAIVQLTRKSEAGLMSVAEASSKVIPIIRNKKKAEKIRASISGTSLQEIANNKNVQVQNATALTLAAPTIPGAGSEPKVVGAAFGKKAGETTDLINGKSGVFKVRVLAINKAPDLDNYASYANQLNATVVPQMNTKVHQALRENADIEDNRASFY